MTNGKSVEAGKPKTFTIISRKQTDFYGSIGVYRLAIVVRPRMLYHVPQCHVDPFDRHSSRADSPFVISLPSKIDDSIPCTEF